MPTLMAARLTPKQARQESRRLLVPSIMPLARCCS
jgi:hypothetical protein